VQPPKTLQEMDAVIHAREEVLQLLPPGKVRQRVMLEITEMRADASLRRLLSVPATQKSTD
jgi:hypothetical protein